jgi:pSer/pThr/pTyr-binding forkhead associated (FHA) protein
MTAVELLSLASGERADPIPVTLLINRFPCVVGRHSGADRRLSDPSVSRRHCAFTLRDGRVWVEDLGSLNGTRLNGETLESARPVADGDLLDLAHLRFRVRLAEEGEEGAVDLGAPDADPEDPTRRRLA